MFDILALFHTGTAFTVFLVIGAVGFLLLLTALLVGEPFGQRAEPFSKGPNPKVPSLLSARTLGVFLTVFGGTCAIAVQMGFEVIASCILGLLSGGFFATLVFLFVGVLDSQHASSDADGPWK